MSSRTTLFILIGLIAAHIVLALSYASATPWRQGGLVQINPSVERDIGAPDERQHANYIFRLARGEGFPVFDPADPNLYETYQGHQPPAYYLLAAGWSKATMASELESKETGFKLRFLNALIGAATVAGAFFLGFWGFKREDVGLAAAAFAGLLPMAVALSGAVSNDPLLIALCTWVLALCARAIHRGWTWKAVLGVGFLVGLALLTKTTALALLPVLLVAALVPQEKKPTLAMAAALIGVVFVVAGPWLARNQNLYGDPLAMKAFNDAFTKTAQKDFIITLIQRSEDSNPEITYWKDWVGWWTVRSFFGVFGYMDIWMNSSGTAISARDPNVLYRLLLMGAIVCGLGWLLASSKDEWKKNWPIQLMNGVLLAIVALLFLRFNLQYFQAQGRYLLPALGPIACGIAIGLVFFFKSRSQYAWTAIAVVLLGVNIYALSGLSAEFEKRIEAGKTMSQQTP
jgi:4-amino-4-deoxy-L-arabinose transferase-like glycosyltransferase